MLIGRLAACAEVEHSFPNTSHLTTLLKRPPTPDLTAEFNPRYQTVSRVVRCHFGNGGGGGVTECEICSANSTS